MNFIFKLFLHFQEYICIVHEFQSSRTHLISCLHDNYVINWSISYTNISVIELANGKLTFTRLSKFNCLLTFCYATISILVNLPQIVQCQSQKLNFIFIFFSERGFRQSFAGAWTCAIFCSTQVFCRKISAQNFAYKESVSTEDEGSNPVFWYIKSLTNY